MSTGLCRTTHWRGFARGSGRWKRRGKKRMRRRWHGLPSLLVSWVLVDTAAPDAHDPRPAEGRHAQLVQIVSGFYL